MSTTENDFNPDDYAKTADVDSLKDRVDSLYSRLGSDESFMATFEKLSSEQKKFDGVFRTQLETLILKDPEIGKRLKQVVNEVDRNWFLESSKRLFLVFWSIVLLAIGALVEHWLKK